MNKAIVCLMMTAAVLCGATEARVDDGEFMTSWLVCGPFDNPRQQPPVPGEDSRCPGLDADFLLEHGGEAKIVPVAGMSHTKQDGSKVEWFGYTSPDDRVAFRTAITKQANVVGYAYGQITSDEAGPRLLALGSDEGVRVWVNGQEVHYNFVKRGINADDDLVPVMLKKGDNPILIKVEQGKGGWGFILRVLPEDEAIASVETDMGKLRMTVSLQMQASEDRREVELQVDGKRVGAAPLVTSHDGSVANGKVWVPFPPAGQEYDGESFDIVVNGESLGEIAAPSLAKSMVEEFRWQSPRGYPGCVFSGSEFPGIDFERSLWVERLIGPYTLSVTFYDAEFNEVERAEEAGRYGAVVDIETAARTTRRFVTLYRQPEAISWWHHQLEGRLHLPAELGVSKVIAEEYAEQVSDFIKGQLAEGLQRNSGGAVLLAALHEAEADGLRAGYYTAPGLRDRAWWLTLKRTLYGSNQKYPNPFVCPLAKAGKPANVVRKGSLREAGMKRDFARRMDKHLKAWEADTDEAFAVAVVRHGVIAFHKAYGMRDGKPMTVDTKSWMASTTKMLSGTLIMMLVEQGLIDLNDRADAFLPPLRTSSKEWPATFRHLYAHTAGFRGHWGSWQSDMEYRVAEKIPFYTVGEQCAYEGAGLDLACKCLEVISGETLPEFYRNHLLGPLGCENTEVADACGGAKSTPLDMAKIGQMLLQKGAYGDMHFFSDEVFAQMLPRELKGKGDLTWNAGIGTTYFRGEGLGEGTFAHGAASSATTRIDPVNDLVIVMTRNDAGANFGRYHDDFLKIIVDSIVPTGD
jgi:CubicO group peptidase (beta-lactamase class C family)